MTTTTTPDPEKPVPAVLDLVQAAALLGLGRTTAYRLVHDHQWPTPVLRLGRLIKIPTQPLLDWQAGTIRETGWRGRWACRRGPKQARRTTKASGQPLCCGPAGSSK